jgi:hypothetical protein
MRIRVDCYIFWTWECGSNDAIENTGCARNGEGLRGICALNWKTLPVQIAVSWWAMPIAWRIKHRPANTRRAGKGFTRYARRLATVAEFFKTKRSDKSQRKEACVGIGITLSCVC